MAFFDDLSKKTRDFAAVAADKAKDVAAVPPTRQRTPRN